MGGIKQLEIRRTRQHELPVSVEQTVGSYNIYPTHHLDGQLISTGYDTLSDALLHAGCIKIDGYVGILFETVKDHLNTAFERKGIVPTWIDVTNAIKQEDRIDRLIAPFLGGDDPVFGKLADLELKDFFDLEKLKSLGSVNNNGPVIFYGTGASLVEKKGMTVYFDISKNEIQFRSRAGSVLNIGATQPKEPKTMYKRFYFVDWVILNRHKNAMKCEIDFLVDGQRSEEITWMEGGAWRESFHELVKSPIRVRPWFEPGAWGGQWIKKKISGLEKEVVNYAWSFELIVPENGIILESSDIMLEYSFDFLMFHAGEKILGRDFKTYQYKFPIRIDFLDTFDGGNLSVQCHPQKEYMQKHFGETITQEETYYILDKKDNAEVFLGFQDGITPSSFREAMEKSVQEKKKIDIKKYVRAFDSHKHDLFLIPPGTIHSAGKDNLVLEISATPYIYTFKMYDWLRLDLEGNPRPLNIERGMENLVFDRSGAKVEEELITKPKVIESTPDWELQHLPTHVAHLYDIWRYHIKTEVSVQTEDQAHVLSLVEGELIEVVTANGSACFSFAETFIMPAASGSYTIKNRSEGSAMVVKALIK